MLSGHRSPRSTRHRRVEVPLVGVTDRNGRVVGLVGELTLFRDLDALANHTSQRLQYEDVRAGSLLSEEFIAALQAMIETVGRFRFRVQARPRTVFA